MGAMLGDCLPQRGVSPLCPGASGLHRPFCFLRHPLPIRVVSVAMSVSLISGGVMIGLSTVSGGPAHVPGYHLVPACLLSSHQHLRLLCQDFWHRRPENRAP